MFEDVDKSLGSKEFEKYTFLKNLTKIRVLKSLTNSSCLGKLQFVTKSHLYDEYDKYVFLKNK